jgi:hypothetical protein
MDIDDALNMSKDYSSLGWAVQEQAQHIIDCRAYPADMDDLDEAGELNLNAVRMIKSWLEDYSEFIDDANEIIEHLEEWMISKKFNKV